MLIVQRHYLKEFFKLLGIVALGLASVFSLLELVNKLDKFLPYRPSLENLMLYAWYNFPRILLYLLPMTILFCSLFVFSHANRREEITAIRAAGGRIKILVVPFLFAGVFLSIFCFVLGEFVVPEYLKKTDEMKEMLTKSGRKFSYEEGTVWLRTAEGAIVKIGLFLPERKLSKDISIFKTGNGSLMERIEAGEAQWVAMDSGGVWKMKGVIVYDVQRGAITKYEKLEYPFAESPDVFSRNVQDPGDMGIRELLRYTRKLEEAGFKNQKLAVDLNSKISYPFINFFMILLGISLPMKRRTGGGLVTTAIGIAISLLYWFSHTMSLSMGYAGILPPVIAAWFVPAAFGIIAIYLFRGIHE